MNSHPLTNTIATAFSQGDIFWLAWYLAAIVFTIHAAIVIYHWFTYGTTKQVPVIAALVYLAGGLALLAAAAGVIHFAL